MKIWTVIGALMLWAGGPSWAQVEVDIELEQEQFLQDESLPIKVKIVNRSGQDLSLGATPDWLTFHVQNREGGLVARRGDVPVAGEFSLEASRVATREVDIMPYFDLPPGRYFISANVKIPSWDREVASRPKLVEVVRGTTIFETVVGIPREDGVPEGRRFALQQAHYLRQPYLYLRLTDVSDLKVFRVMPLGRLLSFSRPEAQVDRSSNFHVLFQTGARSFTYCVVTPEGRLIKRQRHDYTQSRPSLKGDTAGDIDVAGGIRRLSRFDIPAPATGVDSDNDASQPLP